MKRDVCHSLRGLCGLKSQQNHHGHRRYRHSLRGLRGLKFGDVDGDFRFNCHSLRGLCGLKCPYCHLLSIVQYVTACEGCVD